MTEEPLLIPFTTGPTHADLRAVQVANSTGLALLTKLLLDKGIITDEEVVNYTRNHFPRLLAQGEQLMAEEVERQMAEQE